MEEQENKAITKLKSIQCYEVEVSKNLRVEGEKHFEFAGLYFYEDRYITVVGMSAKEIYDMFGEEHILSITKQEQVFIKK